MTAPAGRRRRVNFPLLAAAAAALAVAGALLAMLLSTAQAQTGPASVSEADGTDLPNDNTTPGRVAVGGTATGTIDRAGDQDRFAVELEAGRSYRFDLTGSPGGGGTLPDTYFRAIYNSQGRYQSGSYNDDHDGSRDSQVTFTAPVSGTYYARVSGDRDETGTYTLTVTDITPQQAEQAGERPAKPKGLSATASHDRVVLSWDDPGDTTITGYTILRRVRVNDTGGDFSVLVADTGSAATTYTDDTVAASTTYTYRIKAINEHGVSERSRWYHIDTPAAPVPDKPTGLSATASHDAITLTWDDPGDDSITGYVILRRLPGVDPEGQFDELVADTGTAATTYTDDTVAASTTYTYRIKAINEHGVSERSRWYHIDTPAAPQATLVEGDNPDSQDEDDPVAGAPGHATPGGPGKKANVSEGGTDCPNDTTTTCEVDVGGSATGTIETDLDADDFKVELEAGTRYQFDLEGAPTGRGTLPDPVMEIRSADDLPLLQDDDGGVGFNSRVIYTPTSSGTHYLKARKAGTSAGTYTLSVIVLGANGVSEADTDFPATTATTGRVEVGASATGNTATEGDVDWFKVVLEAGKFYQIDLVGVGGGGGTLVDSYLRNIRDSSGAEISETGNDDIDATVRNYDSRVIFNPTTAGAYYLVAGGAAMTDTGTYTLSVTEVETRADEGDTDFPSDITTLGLVEVGGSATGEIDPVNDVDWFRVVLEYDKTYVFDLEGAETNDGTLANPRLSVRDQTGVSQYSSDDDGGEGLNSRLEFTAPYSGIHYLAASAALSASSGGTYTLSVREAASPDDPVEEPESEEDDLPADTSTTGTVEVDGSAVRGDIYKPVFVERTGDDDVDGYDFDTDWFAVELEAGRTYRIDMKGAIPTNDLTLRLPQINAIYDADGDYLFNTWSRDESSSHHLFRVTFHAHAGGTYYIAASGESFEWGSYKLRVYRHHAG